MTENEKKILILINENINLKNELVEIEKSKNMRISFLQSENKKFKEKIDYLNECLLDCRNDNENLQEEIDDLLSENEILKEKGEQENGN